MNRDHTKTNGWDNATLISRKNLTDDSAIFRIKADSALFKFQAGQYTTIGLPKDSPKAESADPDENGSANSRRNGLIVRAYSIASPSKTRDYIELYVTLVNSGALTPRLWMLQPGDRIWLGPKATGIFTFKGVPAECDVVLIGTGTGLSPYISMINDHHQCNIGRRFVVIHGARYSRDLGYRDELESIQRACRTMVYVPTVSRPETDPPWPGHIGRVQSVIADGTLENALGGAFSPKTTHVFLSGNPEMVEDMETEFTGRGFMIHSDRSPGTLHIERYW